MSEFTMVENTEHTKTDKKTKAVKITACVLASLLLIELVVYKFILPCMSSPSITFTGLKNYTPEQIAVILAPMRGSNWLSFNVDEAVSLLSSEAAIDYVDVSKHFPDKITISIVEREPVAMTFVNNGTCTVPVSIDSKGVLFPENQTAVTDSDTIPIISGLPVEHLTGGMRVPAKYRALIEQIAKIRSLPQKYFAAISEICVVPKEYGNYELVLIPAHSKTRVLTDRALNEDALQYMMIVLDVVNSIQPNVSEIDLRYGSVSYRTR